MKIYCVECGQDVDAVLVHGCDVYPHRPDLAEIPFWQCPACGNYVGCHHKTKNPTRPLGVIPNKELKRLRMMIHSIIDPMWRTGRWNRKKLYARISKEIGKQYHTGELKSIEEAQNIIKILKEIKNDC